MVLVYWNNTEVGKSTIADYSLQDILSHQNALTPK